jgi:hypothetical protein
MHMAEIEQALREQAAASPEASLAVIVTIEPEQGDDELLAAGLEVAHRIARMNVVSGTVQGASLDRLARLPGVLRIEADAPMQAL